MDNAPPPPPARLMQLIWPGALAAQAVHAAARLGIADILHPGPRTADDIARRAHADPGAMRRLLHALTSLDLVHHDGNDQFRTTPLGDTLRTGSPLRAWALMLGSPFTWQPWGRLVHTVRTGTCAFDDCFGMSFPEYMATHPEEADAFDAAMDVNASVAIPGILAACDFSRFHTIVDVGGGRGSLLAGILDAHPGARGILFDLPAVVADHTRLRITHLGERCTTKAGDYFDHVPAGDALLLKNILHGLSDQQAGEVLQHCRTAIRPRGRLILVETILDPQVTARPEQALMDLMMLTLTNGHERTADEFEALLAAADFTLLHVTPTERGHSVLEAAPRATA
ncbi:MAG: hypothetical protein KDA21_01885 [Phycisphaerales bacterium]|nr:hypothetical protein [Phycisphaerales bacterium]